MTTDRHLADDPTLYFDLTVDHRLIRLSDLVPTKPPESQPESVDRAEALMRLAARGRQPKRPPITVERQATGDYRVVDGNATYGVAVRHGFKRLPGRELRC